MDDTAKLAIAIEGWRQAIKALERAFKGISKAFQMPLEGL